MTSPAVKTNNVVKKYSKDSFVIKDLSFEIPKNCIFGLIGSNGIGKTTLIKSILNLTFINGGEIKISDQDHKKGQSRNDLFYLPESFLPQKNLRAIEFLQSYLKILSVEFDNKDLEFYCSMLDINPKYINYKISECSKGTVQKIGLLLAFLSKKTFLLLDEPSAGLDVRARNSLKNTISYFHSKGGTVFLSSHIFSDLESVCTHFGIFNESKFVFLGTKDQIILKQNELGVENLEQLFIKLT
jgi:ABC-2 type transport system ATP-binding protein